MLEYRKNQVIFVLSHRKVYVVIEINRKSVGILFLKTIFVHAFLPTCFKVLKIHKSMLLQDVYDV